MSDQPVSRRAADESRRRFVGSLAVGIPAAMTSWTTRAWAADPAAAPSGAYGSGLIRRQADPDNLEFPFASLNSFITPTEQFFVRTHFQAPRLDKDSWKLAVGGHVERPLELSYEQLRKLPSRTLPVLLECAGNSRVLLKPPQVGLRWEQGGVSNAEWTGVPLAAVLEQAGVKGGAVDVIFEGADQGETRPPDQRTPGVISFAHSLPIAKARQAEVLLAYEMNGQELTVAHGFPLRLVVPGWYGMASVKWLRRIIVSDEPFQGFFQTFTYTIWQRRDGLPTLVPVTEVQVKSQIARPALHEVVPAGKQYRVFGAAWAGETNVQTVEVSTDGGEEWSAAKLLGESVPFAWRLWEFDWQTPANPGEVLLMARATDDRGRVQPMERNDDLRDTAIHHVQRIPVSVAAR